MTSTWDIASRMILKLLLPGLAVVVVVFLLNLRSRGKNISKESTERKKLFHALLISLLLLLLLIAPIVFSLPEGMWLSPRVLVNYLRELVVSIVLVGSFLVGWKLSSATVSLISSWRPQAFRGHYSRPFAAVLGECIDSFWGQLKKTEDSQVEIRLQLRPAGNGEEIADLNQRALRNAIHTLLNRAVEYSRNGGSSSTIKVIGLRELVLGNPRYVLVVGDEHVDEDLEECNLEEVFGPEYQQRLWGNPSRSTDVGRLRRIKNDASRQGWGIAIYDTQRQGLPPACIGFPLTPLSKP